MKINVYGAYSAFTQPDSDPETDLQGELFKRSEKKSKNKKWNLRLCILRGNLLFYGSAPTNVDAPLNDNSKRHKQMPSGMIILEGHQVRRFEDEPSLFCFEITFGNRLATTQMQIVRTSEVTREKQKQSVYDELRAKRSYVFASQSAAEINKWVDCVRAASTTLLLTRLALLKREVAEQKHITLQHALNRRNTRIRGQESRESDALSRRDTSDFLDCGTSSESRRDATEVETEVADSVVRRPHGGRQSRASADVLSEEILDARRGRFFDGDRRSQHSRGAEVARGSVINRTQVNLSTLSFDEMHVLFGRQMEIALLSRN